MYAPDDRKRRPQLVRDEGDELAAGLVERLELVDLRLRLALQPAFSTIPARRSAIAAACATSESVKSRCISVWTLSTPTTWSPHVSGTDSIEAMNRRWSSPRTHPKRQSSLHVRDVIIGSRLAATAGDPLPHRHPNHPADVVAVEAVGGGERERAPRRGRAPGRAT